MIFRPTTLATPKSFSSHSTSERRSVPAIDFVACLLTIGLGALYIGHFAWRNWLPWDDGILAQTAERVLRGQLPIAISMNPTPAA
jgi:hypothetical protein